MKERRKLEHMAEFTKNLGEALSDFYDCAFEEGVESVAAVQYDDEKIEAAINEVVSDQDSMKDLLYRTMLKLGFGKPEKLLHPEPGSIHSAIEISERLTEVWPPRQPQPDGSLEPVVMTDFKELKDLATNIDRLGSLDQWKYHNGVK